MKIIEVINCCRPDGAQIYVKNLLISMHKLNSKNEYELWVLYEAKDMFQNDKQAIKFEEEYINELKSNGINIKKFNRRKWNKK